MRLAPPGKLRAFSKAASAAFQSSSPCILPIAPFAEGEIARLTAACFTPQFWLFRPWMKFHDQPSRFGSSTMGQLARVASLGKVK